MNTRIALPVAGGQFSTHFGHSEHFALYDIKDGKIANKQLSETPPHIPGAFPQWMKQQNVETVIVAGVGQKALDLFRQAGINVITGAMGNDADRIVQDYLNSQLSTDPEFNDRLHADHHHNG